MFPQLPTPNAQFSRTSSHARTNSLTTHAQPLMQLLKPLNRVTTLLKPITRQCSPLAQQPLLTLLQPLQLLLTDGKMESAMPPPRHTPREHSWIALASTLIQLF